MVVQFGHGSLIISPLVKTYAGCSDTPRTTTKLERYSSISGGVGCIHAQCAGLRSGSSAMAVTSNRQRRDTSGRL